MSKVCGLCFFDNRPLSVEFASWVMAALDRTGYLRPQAIHRPGLLAGWAAGSDDLDSPGPWESLGNFCLFDGRIDNRSDLLRLTNLPPDSANATIAATLYQRSGAAALHGLIGDWSLCLWDAERRAMVLASDYAGIRPLYYYRGPDFLYWSSSLADLVAWTGIVDLSDGYIASFLSRGGDATLTPYSGILAVPAGHSVTIAEAGIESSAFWTLPFDREIRHADELDYEAQLLALFRESVQARLSTKGPTCSELSGGLDSSSIVCMADRLRKELVTFSYLQANSPDERFFREVERTCEVSATHLPVEEYAAASAGEWGAIPGWWEPRLRKLARLMASKGSGVLLTGQFGDFVMGNMADDQGQVAECLAHGRISQAVATAYAWGKSAQVPMYPILWRGLREAYFSWTPPTDPRNAPGAMPSSREDSLTAVVRERFQGYERGQFAEVARHAPPGRRLRFLAAAESLSSRRLQTPEALQHLSYAHPYAHRPLLEFMLTIPSHIVFGPGEPRRLMRRAFAGLLPRLVATRKSKGSYEQAFRAALTPMAQTLLERPAESQLVQRGYLDPQSLTSRLERFTQGLDCNETQLRQIILLEFWIRHRLAGQSALTSASTFSAKVSTSSTGV